MSTLSATIRIRPLESRKVLYARRFRHGKGWCESLIKPVGVVAVQLIEIDFQRLQLQVELRHCQHGR
jgi:hypothetical protein